MRSRPLLTLDTASPQVSVAVAREGEVLAMATTSLRRSSETLLSTIEAALQEASTSLAELSGVVALAGPGSFTGLRIGLATVLGFHQALGVPATALPTLPFLAEDCRSSSAWTPGQRVLAAVDALRGDWVAQVFEVRGASSAVQAVGDSKLLPAAEIPSLGPGHLAGFGVEALAEEVDLGDLQVHEVTALAPTVARTVSGGMEAIDWDPGKLTAPIYFRPPAVTPQKA